MVPTICSKIKLFNFDFILHDTEGFGKFNFCESGHKLKFVYIS